MPAKAEVFQRRDGEWSWRLKAANGEVVATGEGYRDRSDALRGFHDMAAAVTAADVVVVPDGD